jgi:hypothetical protein
LRTFYGDDALYENPFVNATVHTAMLKRGDNTRVSGLCSQVNAEARSMTHGSYWGNTEFRIEKWFLFCARRNRVFDRSNPMRIVQLKKRHPRDTGRQWTELTKQSKLRKLTVHTRYSLKEALCSDRGPIDEDTPRSESHHSPKSIAPIEPKPMLKALLSPWKFLHNASVSFGVSSEK